MRTRQEGAESLPGKTCVIVKIATTGCDRAEDELLELTLLDARTRLDTPVMPPPLYFGRFRPRRHRDWPEAGARNGLAPSDVQDAPEPEDPRERGRVQRVLDGTGVLAGFNLPFTLAFLARSFRLSPSLRCLDIMEDWSRYAAGTGPDSRPMWLGMGDLFRTVRVRGLVWRTEDGIEASRNTLGDAARLLLSARRLRARGVRFSMRPLSYFLPPGQRPAAVSQVSGNAIPLPEAPLRFPGTGTVFSKSGALPLSLWISAVNSAPGTVTIRCGVDDPLHLLSVPPEVRFQVPAGSPAARRKLFCLWGRGLARFSSRNSETPSEKWPGRRPERRRSPCRAAGGKTGRDVLAPSCEPLQTDSAPRVSAGAVRRRSGKIPQPSGERKSPKGKAWPRTRRRSL